MNLQLKTLAMVITLAVVTVCLGTCNHVPSHAHEYSADWSFDEINHWHASVCDAEESCSDAVSELSSHTLSDGACTICGWVDPSSDNDDENLDNGDKNDSNDGNTDVGEENPNGGQDGTSDDETNGGDDGEAGNDDPEVTVCEHSYVCEQTKMPTCTDGGENTYTCSLCGDIYTETVAEIGHTETNIPGATPTCERIGLSGGKCCTVCGEITKPQIEISPLGHSFTDGICDTCGAEDPNYEVTNPNVIYTATTDNNCWVDKVSFTASESGEYTFYMPAGLGAWDASDWESRKNGPVIDSLHPNYIPGEFSFTVQIAVDTTYEFYIAAAERREWTVSWSFVACEVEADDGDSSEPITAELEIGNNSIEGQSVIYTYTASSGGDLTLTLSSAVAGNVAVSYAVNGGDSLELVSEAAVTLTLTEGDGVVITVIADGYSSLNADWTGGDAEDLGEEDPFVDFSGEYIGTDAFGNQLLIVIIDSPAATVVFQYYHPLTGPNTVNATYKVRGGVVTLYDESGEKLHPLSGTLVLVDNIPAIASFDGTQYSLSLDIPEPDDGNKNEEVIIKGEMIDGEENTFNVTLSELSADKIYVSFVPLNDGVYDFFSDHIFVDSIKYEDGTSAEKNEYDFYVLKSGVNYVVKISLEYIAHIGNYTITPAYQYPEGHSENPIWYTLGENAVAEYKGDDQPVWYQFYANATGTLTVTPKNDGVTVLISAISDFDISAVETMTLDVVQGRKYYIGIAVYGSVEAVRIQFSASVTEGEITTDGSINVPHIFDLGSNTAEISTAEGMYFIYKSTANGTLKLSAESSGFAWCFTDFKSHLNTVCEDISLHMEMGDLVYLYIENVNGVSYPISFTASFTNDAKQAWVSGPFILDGSAANVIEIDEATYALIQVNGAIGQFKVTWDNPDATVMVNNSPLENGGTIYVTSAWFGPYIKIYLTDYQSGTVNLTISAV